MRDCDQSAPSTEQAGQWAAAAGEVVFAREAHPRSIIETVPDAMIVIDIRGRILSFSAAAERMSGFSEAEALGENISALTPSPDGSVEVGIEDSGRGLAAEPADGLFQPFLSTKAEGMGLGLSICHIIVNAHGGRIWSTPSKLGGTAFHLTLGDASGGSEDGSD